MGTRRDLAAVARAVEATGLLVRGAFHCTDADAVPPSPDGPAATVVLVGSVGARGFQAFRDSPFHGDGAPDPLDRFTEQAMEPVARALGARALYPHAGPPWLPFQRWARRAEPVHASPLGILIHPDHGLWHAYRAALAFPFPLSGVIPAGEAVSPCEDCATRPCLHACPVDAFGASGYDTRACAAHLACGDGRPCLEAGCLARLACPVAPHLRYRGEQARFHMAAFARRHAVAPGAPAPAADPDQ